MSNDPIVITKENDGDMINFFEESSDDSDIQIKRPTARTNNKRRVHPPKTPSTARIVNDVTTSVKPPPLNDNLFEVFTNPDKKRLEEPDDEPEDHEDEPDEDMCYTQPMEYEDEYEEPQPSAGFSNIADEKQDLLYKFYRLTSKGIPVGKKFTMSSDIHEMRHEFDRIQRDNDVKSSIRFSRRMLMACVTGMEFLNKRYDPFEIKLEGWSESVMENMDDYDNVFERLHDKYASRVSMAPEIELLLSLSGSAFMFHLTNSMFNSMPNLKDIAKQNPDILKNLMQSMHNANGTKEPPQTETKQPSPVSGGRPPDNPPSGNKSREMKPPTFDMSSLFENMPMVPIGNATFPVASRETDRVVNPPIVKPILKRNNSGSSLSSLSCISLPNVRNDITKIVSIDTSQVSKSRGRRKNKISATKENTISI